MTNEAKEDPRRKLLNNLTQPHAFGWPLVVASTLVFVVDGFPFLGGNDLSGSRFDRAGIVLVGAMLAQIPIVIVLTMGRFTWLRSRFSKRHPSVAVITLFFATLLADSVFQSHIVANSDSDNLASSLLDQVLFKTAALVFFAILIVDLNEFRANSRALNKTRAVLTASLRRAEQTMEAERRHTSTIVEQSMFIARDELSNSDLHQAGMVLRQIATDIVRPLSHELMTSDVEFELPEVPALPHSPWRHTLARIVDAPLIAPRALALVMVALAWRQTVTSAPPTPDSTDGASVSVTFDVEPFIEAISVLAVLFIATYVSARFISRRISRRARSGSPWREYVVNTIGIAMVAMVVLATLTLAYQLPWFPDPPRFGPWTPLVILVPMLLIASIQAFLRSLESRRTELVHDLERSNTDLKWAVKAINERIWFQRRRLALHVHGPVQNRLNAASLRLIELAQHQNRPHERQSGIEVVRRELRAISVDIADDDTTVDLAEAFAVLVTMWNGICRVDAGVPAVLHQVLAEDPACVAAIDQISQEAVANSVTHGKATIVTITVQQADPRTVRVVITDNGHPESDESPGGLGTQLLDELAIEWSRTFDAQGTTLLVEVPFVVSRN